MADITHAPTPEMVAAARAWASLCREAQEDSALFAELVLRDEETQEPIKMVPMHYEWHQVASEGRNMVVWAHPESGKTQQLIIARSLWLLGRNPMTRIGILAAAEKQVKKIIGAIRQHIETNAILHDIFPNLRKGPKWTDTEIMVKRPDGSIAKDFSVQAISYGGKIQGARIDFLFIDDILVEDNTRTAARRQAMSTWVKSAAFSRLTKRAQIVFLANAFHHEDLAHELAGMVGWWSKKYSVLTETGESSWPDRWPMWRIIQTRDEKMGPTEFARAMLCQPRSDEDARFKTEWIEACKRRGRKVPTFDSLQAFVRFVGAEYWKRTKVKWDFRPGKTFVFPKGFYVFTAVDLGVSRKAKSDPSVLFTGVVWPDGTRQVLNIQRGKWAAPEIKRRIVATQKRFKSQYVIVENNAAQDYLLQWIETEKADLKKVLKRFRTGRNKIDPQYGVESVAVELELKKWLIPTALDKEAKKVFDIWTKEMQYYTPDGHTGDVLMAAWFFREAARVFADSKRDIANDNQRSSVTIVGQSATKKRKKIEGLYEGDDRVAA